MANERAASVSVTDRCIHTVPEVTHCQIRCRMSVGRLKKNLSIEPESTRNCHRATKTAPSSACHTTIGTFRLCVAALITLQNFVPQIRPDDAVQLGKSRIGLDID